MIIRRGNFRQVNKFANYVVDKMKLNEQNLLCELYIPSLLSFVPKEIVCMSIPQVHTVQPVISQFREYIVESLLTAWEEWRESRFIGVWTDRGRANFIWEQTIDHMRRKFSGCHGVRIIRKNETYLFLLHDQVCFRVKKGDEAGLSRNISTLFAINYNDPQQKLPGIPDVQRVEIIYQLNREGSEVIDVLVVAREGVRVMWSYSLLRRADTVTLVPPFVDDPSVGSASPLLRRRNVSGVPDGNKENMHDPRL